jgi:hypothetical protein
LEKASNNMAESQTRIATAMEKRLAERGLLGSEAMSKISPPSQGESPIPEPDIKWVLQGVDPVTWILRNVGDDSAHNVSIDHSTLDVEVFRLEGDWSVVTSVGSVTLILEQKISVPLPDSLLVCCDEQPNPVAVQLPRWF